MLQYVTDRIRRLFRPTYYIVGIKLDSAMGDVELFISDGTIIRLERIKYGEIERWLQKFSRNHSYSHSVAFAMASNLDVHDSYAYRSLILPFWHVRVSVDQNFHVGVGRLNGPEQDQLFSAIPEENWTEALSKISKLIALPRGIDA